jgi:hypothetical protein
MKPTPEMIEAACEAYISRSSMNMGDCMSEALEAALAAMWQPVKAAWVNGDPGTTRTMVFDPNGRIIFIGWGVSYHHVSPSATDSE